MGLWADIKAQTIAENWAKGFAEGLAEVRMEIAIELIREGTMPFERVAELCDMTLEQVQALALKANSKISQEVN